MIEVLEAHLRLFPDDWPSWLVYADWLTDQGDIRGELIVLEHKLRAPSSEEERRVFEQRVAAIQTELPQPEMEGVELEWQHGFLRRAVFEGHDTYRRFLALLEQPFAHLLSSVCFRRSPERVLQRLFSSDAIPRRVPPVLQLEQCALAFQAMGDSALMRQISDLELSSCGLGDEGLMDLLEQGLPEGLRGLVLWNEGVSPLSLEALGAAPLVGLRRLALGRVPLGTRGIRALSDSRLRSLEQLELRSCRLAPAAVEQLASSPLLAGLRRLDLGSNVLSDEGAEALAASPHLRALTHLSLPLNTIGDYGAQMLARSEGLPELVSLNLWGNRIGQVGARALLSSHSLHPTELDLYQNPFGVRRLALPIAR